MRIRDRRALATTPAEHAALDAERDLLVMGDGTKEHQGCQGLLWQLALKYANKCKSLDIDDLAQAGQLALIQAAENFDPDKGFRFTTYASWCISGQLKIAAKKLTEKGIHVPVQHRQRNAEMDEATARLVRAALSPSSLHCRPNGGHDLFQPIARESSLPDTFEVDHLRWALERIPPREREVLELCVGQGVTLQAVGERMGITRERVRQLRIRAMERIRREMGVTECVA